MEVGHPGWTRRGIIGRNIKLLCTFEEVGGEEWCCGWSIFSFIILNTFNPFLDMSLEIVGKEAWRWVQFALDFPRDTEATGKSWEDALTRAIVSFMPSECPCVYWQNTKKKGPLPSLTSRESHGDGGDSAKVQVGLIMSWEKMAIDFLVWWWRKGQKCEQNFMLIFKFYII